MHAIKGSWAGQAFALATSNDSGGRKSRIRRSKEERKAMVESFIKKYQKWNNGNFPSLNLMHKEVGGSFYTVREIVREIIQENRVLAPPKESLEEHVNSEFLEQNPLGSISMEPQIDLVVSDGIHMVTHIVPPKDQISSEDEVSSSTEQFNGSFPLELHNEQIEGVSETADKDEDSDGTHESHQAPNHDLINNDENIINGIEVIGENSQFDKAVTTDVDCQDINDSALLSSQKINGRSGHYNKNDQTVDGNKDFGQEVYTKSAITEILDKDKYGAQDVDSSQTEKSRVSSNVVVETFPLRPVPRTIHDMDGESGNLQEANGNLEAIQSSSGSVNAKCEENHTEEEVSLNHQGSSLECSKFSSASKSVVLDIGDFKDLESEDSLSVRTKATSSTGCLVSEDSITIGRKANGQDKSSLPKENNPTLDRINLETWDGVSKKSTRPESNPLVALVKAFISSFLKLWTK